MIHQVIESIRSAIDFMYESELGETTNIGIITYNNTVQFFVALGNDSGDPSVIMMTNVNNPFVPLPISRVFINLKDGKGQIDAILDKIITILETPNDFILPISTIGSCGGAALKVAIDLLYPECGKILWFLMDIPSVGYGVLKSRNNPSLYNTDKERILLSPDDKNKAYLNMAQICIKERIAIDIFVCGIDDLDLTTILPVTRMTGGEVYYHDRYNSSNYGEKLFFDIIINLTRRTMYDVSIRARCSLGLTIEKSF